MMVVGSTLTHYDKVTGIVYAKRSNRSDRISLWLSSSDREICRQSETEWLEILQKVNQEGFNIGTTSFTNHKGSGHHHRGGNDRGDRGERGGDRENRGGDREHRGEYRGDRGDNRGEYRGDRNDNRGGDREYRGDRDGRDNRDNRDSRDNRDGRGGDRRPSGPNKFSSRGGGSSGYGGPRQSTEGRANDWNRQ